MDGRFWIIFSKTILSLLQILSPQHRKPSSTEGLPPAAYHAPAGPRLCLCWTRAERGGRKLESDVENASAEIQVGDESPGGALGRSEVFGRTPRRAEGRQVQGGGAVLGGRRARKSILGRNRICGQMRLGKRRSHPSAASCRCEARGALLFSRGRRAGPTRGSGPFCPGL